MDYTTEISLIFGIGLIAFKNEQEENDSVRYGTVQDMKTSLAYTNSKDATSKIKKRLFSMSANNN